VDTTNVARETVYISLSVDTDEVSFSVVPDGGVQSGHTVATVVTNSSSGYILSLKADGGNLICGSSGSSIASIGTNGALIDDRWGYGLGTFNTGAGAWNAPGTNGWHVIPVGTAETLVNPTTASDSAGDNYGIYFGARVSHSTPACTDYTQDLTVTATSN
jgi:hypothetical protein